MPRIVLLVALIFSLPSFSVWAAEPPRPAEVVARPRNATTKPPAVPIKPPAVPIKPLAVPIKPLALEEVVLKSGRSYRGLIESVGPEAIKFVQIIRPGTPEMSVAPRKIWRRVVARTVELSAEQREQLAQLVQNFRASDRFATGPLKRLMLQPARRAGWPVKRYRGPLFVLDSSADEATTRRSIVQMEQIFGAYEMMLPPREKPKSKLEIVLWGSPAQYHALLARRGTDMANPAFYSPLDNTVMAGLELPRFAWQLKQVRSFRAEVQQQAAQDRTQIRKTGRKPQPQDISQEELQEMDRARRQRVERESAQMLRELELADQQASFQLQQASQRTFAMLYHEAFHAYLENYVYPQDRYDVPRWLNEGLAQIFENGRLEGDTLHFDGPASPLLEQLQADLRGGNPWSLEELLESDQQGFLVTRPHDVEASHRSYLYSWGVAQYLTQELNLLGTQAMDEYVSKPAALRGARERFEKLVGESLAEFDAHWRQAMLGDTVAPGIGPRQAAVAQHAVVRPAGWQQAELPTPRPQPAE